MSLEVSLARLHPGVIVATYSLSMSKTHSSLVLLAALLVFAGLVLACGGGDGGEDNAIVVNDNDGRDYNPAIDPANFVRGISHPYLTLTAGSVRVFEGEEDGTPLRTELEVTSDTRTILGVVTTVLRDRAYEDGQLVEDTLDWYAQDKDGNVWYFGEDSKEMDNGRVVSTAGSWEAGVKGAKAGIIMLGN